MYKYKYQYMYVRVVKVERRHNPQEHRQDALEISNNGYDVLNIVSDILFVLTDLSSNAVKPSEAKARLNSPYRKKTHSPLQRLNG